MSPKPFLTVAEVATLLQLSLETIRRATRAGELKALKLGRNLRIQRADLDTWVQARGAGPIQWGDDDD